MSESVPTRDVKLIRPSGDCQAIAKTEGIPWSVVEISVEGGMNREVELEWHVIIDAPADREPLPLVFETQEAAKAWTEEVDWAQEFSWNVLSEPLEIGEATPSSDAMELTQSFVKFAESKSLPADSLDAWKLAHDEGVVRSLQLFPRPGCFGDPYVVPLDRPVRLVFRPYSCRSRGWSDLYDPVGARFWLARRPVDCVDIPLNATFAFTTGF